MRALASRLLALIPGWVGRSRDATERHRSEALEAQLRQAQKLEALGLLAGSVAHDFNNLLSVILAGVELVRDGIAADSEAAADLEEVRRAAQCAARLTRQLLAFSRHEVRPPQPLDLIEVVRDSGHLLQRLVPEGIVLDLALAPEPCMVRAAPGHLEQVVMNLVLNARDAVLAVPKHRDDAPNGVIRVEAGPRSLAAGDPRLACPDAGPLPPGRYAALLVSDSGAGMDAATRARIFDPFFTTKEPGRGTGLGLATVIGIVARSGGAVCVESAPGKGATFTVLLPLADAPAEHGAHTGQRRRPTHPDSPCISNQ